MKIQETLALLTVVFSVTVASPCQAQFTPGPFFEDDFEDGEYNDSSPANWMGGSNTTDADLFVVDGSFEIRGVNGVKSAAPVQPGGLPYWSYEDASVATQVRILDGGENAFVGVYGRSLSGTGAYFGGIWGDGRISLGESNRSGVVIDANRLATTLDAVQNDILLKMDFDGTIMRLTAWDAGSEMPLEPQLTYEDATLTSGTLAMVGFGQGDVTFRSFAVSQIPEPSGIMLCSFVLFGLVIRRPRRR